MVVKNKTYTYEAIVLDFFNSDGPLENAKQIQKDKINVL